MNSRYYVVLATAFFSFASYGMEKNENKGENSLNFDSNNKSATNNKINISYSILRMKKSIKENKEIVTSIQNELKNFRANNNQNKINNIKIER